MFLTWLTPVGLQRLSRHWDSYDRAKRRRGVRMRWASGHSARQAGGRVSRRRKRRGHLRPLVCHPVISNYLLFSSPSPFPLFLFPNWRLNSKKMSFCGTFVWQLASDSTWRPIHCKRAHQAQTPKQSRVTSALCSPIQYRHVTSCFWNSCNCRQIQNEPRHSSTTPCIYASFSGKI